MSWIYDDPNDQKLLKLLVAIVDGDVELGPGLPVFGGERPNRDTDHLKRCLWSWSPNAVLVGKSVSDIKVLRRDLWDQITRSNRG